MYAPGHLGELTQTVDFVLVDAVIEETGSREKRLRLLPSRVVVYFVLALALFEDCSYRGVWGKLTAELDGLPLVRPAISSLSRARRRVGAAPLRRLFEILAGPVAHLGQTGSFYRGLRTVAVDGTLLHVPDEEALTWRYAKRAARAWSSATRCCDSWSWSSAAPVRSWPPRSAPRVTANSLTQPAC
ncbi:transposase domain-containing protein [Streptomyces sp. NPDC013157]|uniref:transposase domain-containing protein n=1 Tax=Streptomyces sp. NPDC013157 TaxID=3364861 RepID=UPI0036C417D3